MIIIYKLICANDPESKPDLEPKLDRKWLSTIGQYLKFNLLKSSIADSVVIVINRIIGIWKSEEIAII